MFRFDIESRLGTYTIVEPIGWASRKPELQRDDLYNGIFTSFTVGLTFVNGNLLNITNETPNEKGKAFDILKQLYDEDGILAECIIHFYEYDNNLHEFTLEDTGKIDFTTWRVVSTVRGGGAELNILETSFKQKMRKREDVLINYNSDKTLDDEPITLPVYFDCEIKGMPVADSGIITTMTNTKYDFAGGVPFESYTALLGLFTDYNSPSFNDIVGRRIQPTEEITSSDCYFYSGQLSGLNFNIYSDITFESDNPSVINSWNFTYAIDIVTFDNNGTPINFDNIYNDVTESPFTNKIFDESFNVELTSKQGIYIRCSFTGLGILGDSKQCSITINKGNITTDFLESFAPTNSKVTFPYEVISQLKEAITGDTTPIDASIFNRPDTANPSVEYGKYSLYSLMNGLMIRNFELDQANLSFTWKDLYLDLDKIFNIGIAIENDTIVIRDKKDFYTDNIIHTFDKDDVVADSFEKAIDLDWFYGDVEIGYAKAAYEEISGLLEYNSKTYYNTFLSNVANKLELVSTIRGDGRGIELARQLQAIVVDGKNNETTDSEYDEDNFIMDTIFDAGYIQRDKEGFDSVTIDGVESVNPLINLSITPAQNVRRHSWMLLTGLQKYADKVIKFNKSDNTINLVTESNGVTVDEDENLVYNQLDPPIFSGTVIECEVRASLAIYKKIKSDPYGLVKVWNEVEEQYNYGWIKSFAIESEDSSVNLTLIEAKSVSEVLSSWLWNDGDQILWNDSNFIALNN